MATPDFYLYLGCEGFQDQGFVHCPGVENLIYVASESEENFQQIIEFFVKIKLFDYPLRDYNSVLNFLSGFKERYQSKIRPKWTPSMFSSYQKFVINHKQCPVYLRLGLPPEKSNV